MSNRNPVPRARSAGLAVALLASACATSFTPDADPLEGDDTSVFSPRLRATLPLRTDPAGGRATSLELELATLNGDFSQSLSNGENIRLDDILFSGPLELQSEFELTTASLLFHFHGPRDHRIRTGAAVGLSATELEIDASSGAQSDHDRRFTLGPMVAGQASTGVWKDLDLYARLSWSLGFNGSDELWQTRAEAGASWWLSRHVGLAFGWQLGTYDLDEDSDIISDIELRYGGPFATLLVRGAGRSTGEPLTIP